MPTDCLHDQCDFLLWDLDARCPACGRLPVLLELQRRMARPLTIVGFGLVVGLGLAVLAQVLGALAVVGAVMVAALVAVAGFVRARQRWHSVKPATLDSRYKIAAARSTEAIERWNEVRLLRFGDTDLAHDEEMAIEEAESLAAVVVERAIHECHEVGARYVRNSLERLAVVGHKDTFASAHDVARAVAIVERYLTTLWVDSAVAAEAQARLDRYLGDRHEAQRREALIDAVAAVSLFSDHPQDFLGADLAAHRRRLEIERRLDL